MAKDERKARKQAKRERLRRAHPERDVQSRKAQGLPTFGLVSASRPRR